MALIALTTSAALRNIFVRGFVSPRVRFGAAHRSCAASCTNVASRSSSSGQSESTAEAPEMPSTQLEIEQKFSLIGAGDNSNGSSDSDKGNSKEVQQRLQRIGFVEASNLAFVDWYYDTDDLQLSVRDAWLRYRHLANDVDKGKWQLKEGANQDAAAKETSSSATAMAASNTTVYLETEGDEAVRKVIEIIQGQAVPSQREQQKQQQQQLQTNVPSIRSSFDEYDSPVLPSFTPPDLGLQPFCRIGTERSSWTLDPTMDAVILAHHKHAGMAVDLDVADTGYAVGEVEAIVAVSESKDRDGNSQQANDVAIARQRVQQLIQEISFAEYDDAATPAPPVGKLEHYLMNKRPEHYAICMNGGIFGVPPDSGGE